MQRHFIQILIIFGLLIGFSSCSSKKNSGPIEPLTYDTFIEKVWDFKSQPDEFAGRNKKPCVIIFSSSQSEPCKKLQPIIEALQKKHKDQVTFYSVDVEAEQALGNSFKIDIVPTVMLFPKDGQPQMVQGLRSQTEYDKIVDQLVVNS